VGGDGAAVFQGEGGVALELDGHGHGDLAEADAAAEDAGEGARLAVVVEELQDEAVLAGAAAQLQAEGLGGGGAADGDLGAVHGALQPSYALSRDAGMSPLKMPVTSTTRKRATRASASPVRNRTP